MKTFYRVLLPITLVFLSSCVYSLFPIYTAKTLVELPALEGKWQDQAGNQIEIKPFGLVTVNSVEVTVEPGDDEYFIQEGDTIRNRVKAYYSDEMKAAVENLSIPFKGYMMNFIEGGDTLSFQANVAKIGSRYYLDLYPNERFRVFEEAIGNNFFPVHSFMKIELENDRLVLTQFNLTKLKDLFKANKIRLRHEYVEGTVLITAKPEEIQKFLLVYSENKDVDGEITTYQRVAMR